MVDEGFVRIGMPELHQSLQRVVEGNQRLEAKVDTALSIQTLRLEQLVKDLTRLEQKCEQQKESIEDQIDEQRQRLDALDRRPVVTPKAMMAAVTVMGSLTAIVVSILNLVLK